MKRRTIKHILAGAVLVLALTSCGSKQLLGSKQFLITSNSENLTVLTKITDSENSKGLNASGGYGYDGVLLTLQQRNGYRNIYKKDDPLSPSMSEITSGDGYNESAVMCLATDRIVYKKAGVTSSADIYMLPATNVSAMIPITETSGYNEFNPSISKNGHLIVYQRAPFGIGELYSETEIWMKNVHTNENMLLGKGIQPMISPDGTKIVYVRYEGNDETHIWVMNINGSAAQQLTGSKKEFALNPCWSQDGKYIVFQCSTEQKKDIDLYVMKADGTGLRQLTTNDSFDGHPYWGTNDMIYFTSDRGSKANDYQIWRFNYRP